jgi:hypothetical protein
MWLALLCYVDIMEVLGLYHVIIWIHELQLANLDFEFDLKKVTSTKEAMTSRNLGLLWLVANITAIYF